MIHNSFLLRGVVHWSYTLLWTRFSSDYDETTLFLFRCCWFFLPCLRHPWLQFVSSMTWWHVIQWLQIYVHTRYRCHFWLHPTSTSQNIITETTGISLVFTTYFHSKKKIHHAIFTHLVSRIPIDVCGGGRQFYATTTTTITTTTIDGIHNNNIWTNRHPTAHVRWNLTRITRG